ncbi:RDD family protein [Nocardioides sp.]|uniref:RDD family protein n=1 Tax=Nocardioides sp. TaxID=35761 RepID=UPI002B27AC15|nr:RDD family protein [Nocardioides sp.]
MSSYDPPPPPSEPNPYGQPNPYDQPSPYGQPPYGQPGYGQAITPDYAHWGKRVGALLIDGLVMMLAYIPVFVGTIMIVAAADTTTTADGTLTMTNDDVGAVPILLIVLGVVAYLAFYVWNIFIKQGSTGYTIGKGVLGIKLISEQTGQPIGAGKAFVRQLAHILDSFCYIGYLWPLWDAKNQTFADKIMTTIVVNQPKG